MYFGEGRGCVSICMHYNRTYGDFHIREETRGQRGSSSPNKLFKNAQSEDLTSTVCSHNHSSWDNYSVRNAAAFSACAVFSLNDFICSVLESRINSSQLYTRAAYSGSIVRARETPNGRMVGFVRVCVRSGSDGVNHLVFICSYIGALVEIENIYMSLPVRVCLW